MPLIALFTCALLLSACGNKSEKGASQVAAKVNGDEISVHQINFALQQQHLSIAPAQADAAGRRLLDRLIDQDLAVQKAIDNKLDRDPRIVQVLEAARREVLAEAYLEHQTGSAPKPTAQEEAAYYAGKPALFESRRIYTFLEFSIQLSTQEASKVQSILQAAKSPQAFGDALKAAGLPFTVSSSTRPAENLPLDQVDKFAAMSDGQALLLSQPGGARALILVSSVAAPVSLEQARPAIGQFLFSQSKRHIAETEIKALRNGAKIVYVGKFAEAAASAPAPVADATPTPVNPPLPVASASLAASAPGPAAAASPESRLDTDAIHNGIKGLK
jgi:EpsD family peptidyl-prolyl cis-trans isomerase